MDRDQVINKVIEEVRPFSMVHFDGLAATVSLVFDVIDSGIDGELAECGTWLGGASFAMLLAQRLAYGRIVKPVWMFDSFEGLPPAGNLDGPLAAAYQTNTQSEWYYDNCRAPLEQVRAAIAHFQFSESEAIVVPGWFDATLPASRQALSQTGLALLRVDCDWYDPVLSVLTSLAPLVTEEGRVIIDDYFFWDGCALAVHEYLASRRLPWRIRTIGSSEKPQGAWLIKRAARGPNHEP